MSLAVLIRLSVTSDAQEMVPTGELTLFAAVGRAGTSIDCFSVVSSGLDRTPGGKAGRARQAGGYSWTVTHMRTTRRMELAGFASGV
jgi:hypothetical protein